MEQVPWLSHLVAVQLVDQGRVDRVDRSCNIPRVTCSRVRRRCRPVLPYRSAATASSGSCDSSNTPCLAGVAYSVRKRAENEMPVQHNNYYRDCQRLWPLKLCSGFEVNICNHVCITFTKTVAHAHNGHDFAR